tara:strand:+ start:169 stop:429 length:261 start_codon:yes stop_codon:yes gene_type:complete
MKITEDRLTFYFLFDRGFTEKEIDFIKKRCEKEGVKYCLKTFRGEDLEEVKDDLREYFEKQKLKKVISAVKHMFSQYPKNVSTMNY